MQIIYPVSIHFSSHHKCITHRVDIVTDLCAVVLEAAPHAAPWPTANRGKVKWTELLCYRASAGSFRGEEIERAQSLMRRFLTLKSNVEKADCLLDKVVLAFSEPGFEYTGPQLHLMVGIEYEWRSIVTSMSKARHRSKGLFKAGYDYGLYRNRPTLKYGNLGAHG